MIKNQPDKIKGLILIFIFKSMHLCIHVRTLVR